jgi:methylmalonyl-CoA mutase cobalamin-binding domain/chain
MGKEILAAIAEAMANLEVRQAQELVEEAMPAGVSPIQILDALRQGLNVVGQRFAACEYFVSDLIISGQIMKNAMKALVPFLEGQSYVAKERVVLGSALGDMHDIGKEIVKTMLISQGYEVNDLGVDVPSERFVEGAKEVGAKVIGISALLSTTVPMSAHVIKQLEKEALRSRVKVILGGGAARKEMIKTYRVDAAVVDVIEGLSIIRSWTST